MMSANGPPICCCVFWICVVALAYIGLGVGVGIYLHGKAEDCQDNEARFARNATVTSVDESAGDLTMEYNGGNKSCNMHIPRTFPIGVGDWRIIYVAKDGDCNYFEENDNCKKGYIVFNILYWVVGGVVLLTLLMIPCS